MAKLFVGTSGFAYPSWKPGFYPAKLPAKKFLEHYALRLNSTEVNYTFRQLPALATLENWVAATPQQFLFSLKAHMRLTHILKLRDAGAFLEVFLRAIDPLRTARRLGPILFQLPPSMKCDAAVLADFLPLLPPDQQYSFEFRHDSWLRPEIYDLLGSKGAALCLAESEKLVIPQVLTAPFVYSRLRKPDYSESDREEIKQRVESLLAREHDVYVYFKHEESPAGAMYGEELLQRFSDRREDQFAPADRH